MQVLTVVHHPCPNRAQMKASHMRNYTIGLSWLLMHPLSALNVILIEVCPKQNVKAHINQQLSGSFQIHHLKQWINSQQQAALTVQLMRRKQYLRKLFTNNNLKSPNLSVICQACLLSLWLPTLCNLHLYFVLISKKKNLKKKDNLQKYNLGQKMAGIRSTTWWSTAPSYQGEMQAQGELKPFLPLLHAAWERSSACLHGKHSCWALPVTSSLAQDVMKNLKDLWPNPSNGKY